MWNIGLNLPIEVEIMYANYIIIYDCKLKIVL